MAFVLLTGCLIVAYAINPEMIVDILNSEISLLFVVGYLVAVIYDIGKIWAIYHGR